MTEHTVSTVQQKVGQNPGGVIAAGLLEVEVVQFTSELIQIDTSNDGTGDACERPAAEYVAQRLAEAGIDAELLEAVPGRTNVVARITGSDPSLPGLLVHGHLDVVPAVAEDWSVHPFSGEIRDGQVWGRGAVDMKNMLAMMLAVPRAWSREGRRPQRDIVLAFTADEEDSMAYGSEWLVNEHAELFEGCTDAISENGGWRFHAASGARVYPIGTAERGTAWLKLTAHGRAGHGSSPNSENAVARLGAAVARIDAYDWPIRMTPTIRAALREFADIAGTQIDPDDPALTPEAVKELLGSSAAIVELGLRNSSNPTMLSAGYMINVIPESAYGHVDGRVIPGGEDEFCSTIDSLVGPDVTWEFEHRDAALESPVEGPMFNAMRDALLAEDREARVVPYCLGGGTDAKQFSRLGINCYGFAPLGLPPGYDLPAMFHGVDERVPVEALHFGVRVLDRFMSSVR